MSERTNYFVDTSVLLRFLLGDHEEHLPLANEFFRRVSDPKLSFADCAHAVLAMELPNQSIVAFDEDFLLVGGLTRIKPPGPDTQ